MRRSIPVIVAALLVVAAFTAGYALRSSNIGPEGRNGGQVLAQSPSPSPRESPRGQGQRDRGDRAIVIGTVESLRDRTLVVKVSQARGVKADQGAMFTTQVAPDATVLREIALAELKKGNTVTLRGGLEDGKFVVRQVIVELR